MLLKPKKPVPFWALAFGVIFGTLLIGIGGYRAIQPNLPPASEIRSGTIDLKACTAEERVEYVESRGGRRLWIDSRWVVIDCGGRTPLIYPDDFGAYEEIRPLLLRGSRTLRLEVRSLKKDPDRPWARDGRPITTIEQGQDVLRTTDETLNAYRQGRILSGLASLGLGLFLVGAAFWRAWQIDQKEAPAT